MVQILCDSLDGVFVDDLIRFSSTPLQFAVLNGASVEIVDILLR